MALEFGFVFEIERAMALEFGFTFEGNINERKTMDIGAMKQDLTRCLQLLPPGMVNPPAIAKWVMDNRAKLEIIIPDIIEVLKPHVMAGMMEAATGMMDSDEIERACIETLLAYGVNVADAGQTG